MKLTRRQLNRIILESLGVHPVSEVKGIPKMLNYRKMRKDLFALKKDIDNQTLLDKVSDHIDDLQTKVSAGESKFFKGRYQEAVTLLQAMKAVMDNPTPAAATKAIEKVPDEQPAKQKQEPTPEPKTKDEDKWNPDPKPTSGWEYQNRDCIWYARKKGTTKEYTLGHASGKPAKRGGKFLKTIVKLNKAFEDSVKGCEPMTVVPKPKPKPKPNQPEPDPGTDPNPNPKPGPEQEAPNVNVSIKGPLKELAKLFRKLRKIRKEGGGFMSATRDFANAALPHGIPADIDGGYADMIIACQKAIEDLPGGIDKAYDYMNKNLGNNFTLKEGLKELQKRWEVAARVFKANGYRQGEFAELCNDIDKQMRLIKQETRQLSFAMGSKSPKGKIWVKENEERLSRGALYRRRYGRY